MNRHRPITHLPTHEVENQARPLLDYNLFDSDVALREALEREGGGWAASRCRALGAVLGTEPWHQHGHDANRFVPQLKTFDRYGHRIDEVEFHPSYHALMALAMEHELPTLPHKDPKPGAHVAHVALGFLFTQIEAGVMCPMVMTYAAVPALRHQPDVAEVWLPRILKGTYDPRMIPADQKKGVTIGMAMTEKQGGSDVRANTTRARPVDRPGPGQPYLLTGHKWFCSAPMCDAFLTLANTDKGLTCFLVPRFRPDRTRNNFFIQRLKDKLGNKSNASSEIEYLDTWAQMLGEEGRGIRTIIDMVHHTRLDAGTAPAGMMRQALSQAIHHCSHRKAFGKRLIEQPLMRNVLADLALEVEAAVAMCLRVARAYDQAASDEHEAKIARIGTAVMKYWVNKRAAGFIYEALECHGGAGYVEESPLPRLYREAPLNSIWEGSGNVICLDVLRAAHRDPTAVEAMLAEIAPAVGADARIGAGLQQLQQELSTEGSLELRARRITETIARLWQASLLTQHGPASIADAWVRTRVQGEGGLAYGTLPDTADLDRLIERATPHVTSG